MANVRTYYRISSGQLVRTQAEIPKGEPIDKVEIPMDTHGMLAWLNNMIEGNSHDDTIVEDEPLPQTQPEASSPPPSPPAAPATLTLTDVEEFIQGADAGRLARITENACWRMKELAKELQ